MKKLIIFIFLIGNYLPLLSQTNKNYLHVKIIGKADYVDVLGDFFLEVDSIKTRNDFNKLIFNDSIFLLYLNDTAKRIYYHPDLSLLETSKVETLLKNGKYHYSLPINNEIDVEINLVFGYVEYEKRKFFKAMPVPRFSLNDYFIDYKIVLDGEIKVLKSDN